MNGRLSAGRQRILFWTPQLCERGTEVAIFDYADGCEAFLGLEAWIAYDLNAWNNFEGTIARFRARFDDRVVALCSGFQEIDNLLEREDISLLHCLRVEGLSSHVSCVA